MKKFFMIIALFFLISVNSIAQTALDFCFKGSVNTDNAIRVFVSGIYAYVVDTRIYANDAEPSIKIVDISDPTNPVIAGSLGLKSNDIFVSGSYLYVTNVGEGTPESAIKIVDISDPTNPVIVGSVDTYQAMDVFVVGDYAYVADYSDGIKVIDISDPTNPVIVGSVDNTHRALVVFVFDGYLYVANDGEGTPEAAIDIIDISDPTNPVIVGSVYTYRPNDIFVFDGYLYVADDREGIKVINISDPTNPVIVGAVDTYKSIGVFVSGDYLYVADYLGLKGINISDPTNPVIEDSIGTYRVLGVAASESYIYTAHLKEGLKVIEKYCDVATDVEDNYLEMPIFFSLQPNYPNPFNPNTAIQYSLPTRSYVTIEIFNILGQKITTLINGNFPAGNYTIEWDGSDNSSGIYFYKMISGDFVQSRKMLLLK